MKSQSMLLLIMCLLAALLIAAVSVSALPSSQPSPSSVERWSQASSAEIGLELVNQIGGPVMASAIRGNHAYVGIGPNLTILNVANPAQPVVVAKHFFPGLVKDLVLSGNYVYVTSATLHELNTPELRLHIVHVGNPANPVEVGHCNTPSFAHPDLSG